MVFNFSIVGGTWGGGMGMVLVALPSIYAHIGKRTETGMYVSTYLLDRKKKFPSPPRICGPSAIPAYVAGAPYGVRPARPRSYF